MERDWGLRIAKLGTRLKGGSPKDNCEFKSKETGVRIQESGEREECCNDGILGMEHREGIYLTLCSLPYALCFLSYCKSSQVN